jgi:hypothetical protein
MTQRVTGQRFRQRKLSTKQNLPVLREHEVEKLADDEASRHIPRVETGVEKGEEIVSFPLGCFGRSLSKCIAQLAQVFTVHVKLHIAAAQTLTCIALVSTDANSVDRSTICRLSYLPHRQQPRDQPAERLHSSSSQPRMPSLATCNMMLYTPSTSRSQQHTFDSLRP